MSFPCHSRAAESSFCAAASRDLPRDKLSLVHPSFLFSLQNSPPCPQHATGWFQELLIRPRFFQLQMCVSQDFWAIFEIWETEFVISAPPMVSGVCSHGGSWRNLILDSSPNCIFEMVLMYSVELTRASPLVEYNRFSYYIGKNM